MQDGAKRNRNAVVRDKVKENVWRRKLASGKWRYEVTYTDSDGHERRKAIDGGLREALLFRDELKARRQRGQRVLPSPKLSVERAAELWLAAKGPQLAPKTMRAYRYALETHVVPQFGKQRLDRLDVTAISEFVARMATKEYRQSVERRLGRAVVAESGYSPETIKSALTVLSRTYAYARRHLNFAGENVVMALENDEKPGYGQHRKKKPRLNRDELDALIENAVSPWREMIATAAALGTRIGETCGITWGCVDFDLGIIEIAQQATANRELARLKTQSGYRRIEAPDWLLTALREHKLRSAYCADSDLVFCTSTGRPHSHGNVLARGLYPALARAGLPKTSFHSLRHTHAGLWLKSGGDAVSLSKRLGHANPQVTMSVYADIIEEVNDSEARKARLDTMFGATKMAGVLAGTGGELRQRAARDEAATVVSLPVNDDGSQEKAAAVG
jgi:integrase